MCGAGQHEWAHVVLCGVGGQQLLRCNLSLVVDDIFPYLVYSVLVVLSVDGWNGEIQVVYVVWVKGHTAGVAAFG